MDEAYDVVVVGGGVIGSATARWLASDHDVLVVDRGSVGGETTPKASGLATMVPDFPSRPEAGRYAVSFFEEFDGTGNFTYHERPGINLVRPDEESWAREHAAEKREQGFDVTYLEPDELDARYPGVFDLDGFAGGIEFDECGWVDPYTYTVTLKEAAEANGARYEANTEVSAIAAEDGRVTGVLLGDDHVEAETVVCATGWRTGQLLSDYVEVPVRPFRWQTVNLAVDRDLDETFPMGWDGDSRTYWRAESNGDLHVGGGTYSVTDPDDRPGGASEQFKRHVAETIVDRIKDIDDARVVSDDACPTGDADTPDGLPILDAPKAAPDGLVVAITGPVGGIMCSPFVAGAVRSLVTGEDPPAPIDDFALDRFETWSEDFVSEHVSYWTL